MLTELFWFDHLMAILLGVILPVLTLAQSKISMPAAELWSSASKINFYKANSGFLWLLAMLVIVNFWWTGRALPLHLQLSGQVVGLLVFSILLYFFEIGLSQRDRHNARLNLIKVAPFLPSKPKELWGYFLLAASAGICEEIMFRGFLLNYLLFFFETPTYPIILSGGIFAIVHIYQGMRAVFKIFVFSLLFALLFLWTQSLLIPILLHIVIDVISGLAAYRVLSNPRDD
jgi:uncharacterized protein